VRRVRAPPANGVSNLAHPVSAEGADQRSTRKGRAAGNRRVVALRAAEVLSAGSVHSSLSLPHLAGDLEVRTREAGGWPML
jgi:hypothetical protein